MLDLKTVLVVSTATAALQAIAWCSVCMAWRHLKQMKYFAAGFALITLGLMTLILRGQTPGVAAVVVSNMLVKAGLVLLAEGLILFLGQASRARLWITGLLGYGLFWSFVTLQWPGNIALRIHSSSLFTLIVMGLMTWALLRDRSLPRLLRVITIGVLASYMAATLMHSAIEIIRPAPPASISIMNDRNSWYLLQGNLFLISIFACLLFMVSSRLSEKLKENNQRLQAEVQERKLLQDRLNASLEAEHALRDEQRDLMRVVAHEFRTPLAMIRNSVEMISLVGAQSSESTQERLQGISDAVNRLLLLVKRFITQDKITVFLPGYVSVEALVSGVQSHFDISGQSDRLEITTRSSDALICLDEDMILTVVINMIDNALKFSPADRRVSLSMQVEAGFFEVIVLDRGIGIPAAEAGRVGRRFYRGSNSGQTTGSGLGVYASRKLLAYHQGSLILLPRPGGGTQSVMRLPLITHSAATCLEKTENAA